MKGGSTEFRNGRWVNTLAKPRAGEDDSAYTYSEHEAAFLNLFNVELYHDEPLSYFWETFNADDFFKEHVYTGKTPKDIDQGITLLYFAHNARMKLDKKLGSEAKGNPTKEAENRRHQYYTANLGRALDAILKHVNDKFKAEHRREIKSLSRLTTNRATVRQAADDERRRQRDYDRARNEILRDREYTAQLRSANNAHNSSFSGAVKRVTLGNLLIRNRELRPPLRLHRAVDFLRDYYANEVLMGGSRTRVKRRSKNKTRNKRD